MVVLPDHLPILAGGMPDFGAVQAAAVPSVHDAGEEVNSVVAVRARLSGSHLLLHQIEGLRADDDLMIPVYTVVLLTSNPQ